MEESEAKEGTKGGGYVGHIGRGEGREVK